MSQYVVAAQGVTHNTRIQLDLTAWVLERQFEHWHCTSGHSWLPHRRLELSGQHQLVPDATSQVLHCRHLTSPHHPCSLHDSVCYVLKYRTGFTFFSACCKRVAHLKCIRASSPSSRVVPCSSCRWRPGDRTSLQESDRSSPEAELASKRKTQAGGLALVMRLYTRVRCFSFDVCYQPVSYPQVDMP
jgi:hypothetical protein